MQLVSALRYLHYNIPDHPFAASLANIPESSADSLILAHFNFESNTMLESNR